MTEIKYIVKSKFRLGRLAGPHDYRAILFNDPSTFYGEFMVMTMSGEDWQMVKTNPSEYNKLISKLRNRLAGREEIANPDPELSNFRICERAEDSFICQRKVRTKYYENFSAWLFRKPSFRYEWEPMDIFGDVWDVSKYRGNIPSEPIAKFTTIREARKFLEDIISKETKAEKYHYL